MLSYNGVDLGALAKETEKMILEVHKVLSDFVESGETQYLLEPDSLKVMRISLNLVLLEGANHKEVTHIRQMAADLNKALGYFHAIKLRRELPYL